MVVTDVLSAAVFAASDSSTRERLLSLIHAANRKLRLRDKSKSLENDAFVPSISSRSKSVTRVHCVPPAAEAELMQPRSASRTVGVCRYPAYHLDANRNAVSLTTANCKPLLMRRVTRSYESLNSVRTHISTNSSRTGSTLPVAYRSVNR